MILVAVGAQDVHLTCQPEISFKTAHQRYANFACENVITTFNSTPQFGGLWNVFYQEMVIFYKMYIN